MSHVIYLCSAHESKDSILDNPVSCACMQIYYVEIVGTYTASYIELQLHENIQLVSWHGNLHLNYKCTHPSNCMKIYS